MALSRPRRQFEVFDIAIVAVVTKALGAFLVLVVILLPYYRSDPINAPVVEVVRDNLRDARRAVEAAQSELNKKADHQKLAEQIERARQSIEQAQGYVQGLRNKLDQASGQIKRLEAEAAENKAKAEEALRQLDQARERVSQLEGRVQSLERDNQTLRTENAALSAETERLKQDMQRLKDQVEALQSRLQAETRTSQEMRDRMTSLERDRDRARQDADRARQDADRARRDADQAHQDVDRARQEAAETRRENERFKENARVKGQLDPSVVMRWFSIGLIIPECADVQFTIYVRWEGSLINAGSGIGMPNSPFEAINPTKRTTLLGHRYFDLGAKNDDGVLGDKSLREAGVTVLGRAQLKLFNAVSSEVGEYDLYIAPNNLQALTGRRCAIHPYYLTWAGAVMGERVVLTPDQPFAWLRRFRINTDGTNSLAVTPREDAEFQKLLAEFSADQSQRLCSQHSICGKQDAHHFALRGERRSSR
jgi:uncharacterized coiled-coil DUF342 family protein